MSSSLASAPFALAGWFNVAATCLDRYLAVAPDEPVEEHAGTTIPRWKLNAGSSGYGPWQRGSPAHYLSSYHYLDGVSPAPHRRLHHLRHRRHLARPWGSVALLVRNLADRRPADPRRLIGYDAQPHDPRGRLVSLTVRGTL